MPDDLAARVRELIKAIPKPNNKLPTTLNVKPKDPYAPSNEFTFILEDKEYPALLVNLPCPVEVQKTPDRKMFLKSADVGQMLQVFHTEREREQAKAKICKTIYGEFAPSGITPPTHDIVKRRFEKTHKETNHFPYRIKKVTEEIESLSEHYQQAHVGNEGAGGGGGDNGTNTTTTPAKGAKKQTKKQQQQQAAAAGGGAAPKTTKKTPSKPSATSSSHDQDGPSDPTQDPSQSTESSAAATTSRPEPYTIVKVVEEIVAFEEWMVDPSNPSQGRSLTITGHDWTSPDAQVVLAHPEMLITEEDIEEEEIELLHQKDKLEKQRLLQLQQQQQQQQLQQQQQQASSETAGASLSLSLSLKRTASDLPAAASSSASSSSSAAAVGSEAMEVEESLIPPAPSSGDGGDGDGDGGDAALMAKEEDDEHQLDRSLDEDDVLPTGTAEDHLGMQVDEPLGDEDEEEEEGEGMLGTAVTVAGATGRKPSELLSQLIMDSDDEDDDEEGEGEGEEDGEQEGKGGAEGAEGGEGEEEGEDEDEDEEAWMKDL